MSFQNLRYALVRLITDTERMEPENIGVIVQSDAGIEYRLDPNVAKRADVETETFRKWKAFLDSEVHGAEVPLFQPKRTSTAFLEYLQKLCDRTVTLSRTMTVLEDPNCTLSETLESLYARLVAKEPKATERSNPKSPAGRFRALSEDRRFLTRGLKRHAQLKSAKGEPLWMAYRQCANGVVLAVDKIEVNLRIGATANEIQSVAYAAERAKAFVGSKSKWFVIADQLAQPFGDQSREDFEAMKKAMEKAVASAGKAGASLMSSVKEVEQLSDEIDGILAAHDSPTS